MKQCRDNIASQGEATFAYSSRMFPGIMLGDFRPKLTLVIPETRPSLQHHLSPHKSGLVRLLPSLTPSTTTRLWL